MGMRKKRQWLRQGANQMSTWACGGGVADAEGGSAFRNERGRRSARCRLLEEREARLWEQEEAKPEAVRKKELLLAFEGQKRKQ